MRDLAAGALIDAMNAATRRENERIANGKWIRQNATVKHGLPENTATDDPTPWGMLYAVANGQETGGNSDGKTGGEADAATGKSGTSSRAAQTIRIVDKSTDAGDAATTARGRGEGEIEESNQRVDNAGSRGNTEASSGSNPRGAGVPSWVWPAAIAAAVGAGPMAAATYNWLNSDEKEESVETREAESRGSLYQWLEDHGYHMP